MRPQKQPTVSLLSGAERQAIVQELDDNGLFLLKSGLPALTKFPSVSEPTIYRYLSKVNTTRLTGGLLNGCKPLLLASV